MNSIRPAVIRELVPLFFVQDISRSAAFYCEKLGFEFDGKWEPNGKLAWCRLKRGGCAIMLQQAEAEDGPAEGRGHGVTFYFNCDAVNSMHAELTQRGIPLDPPKAAFYGMTQVFIQDPDGYELCFQSPVGEPFAADCGPIP
ncbi:MAG: Glyoxalase-like domain protein [Planctomycetaceae bacterium]|nr:Glyoxalase-like domain protein [Planctomycetaceae bacterium]